MLLGTIALAFFIFLETTIIGNFSISERILINTTPSANAEKQHKGKKQLQIRSIFKTTLAY
jgi:hypothetical protein